MEFFANLGQRVERRWQAEQYSEDRFHTIAADALRDERVHERLDPGTSFAGSSG